MRLFPAALFTAALAIVPQAGPAEALSLDADMVPASAVKRIEISARLLETAMGDRDALLALAAAKLRKSALGKEVAREPERDGPVPEGAAEPPISWQDMRDTALALAPGDPVIEGLAADLTLEKSKGVVSGKVYSISQIRAGGTDTYRPLQYEGNAYAEVYVEGASAADLNVKVFDQAGRLVCSDTDISAIAYCGWRPAASEEFSVVVLNRGGGGTSYTLITN
ncbi:hypothetical protein [Pseudooceanicola sp.]|uniref:hypothetical protein n=1 Tax=Pseudooceanicola sp. TaxID=1914328 RepID=UPI0026330514|nr:hypothetical protein [Pseudooceanicola sp.]MDF1855129.1 hypothetical protein [Pseudooceanicola sp.]